MMEVAERSPHRLEGVARRSAARLAAVQALYQIDQSAASPDVVLEEFLRFRLGDSFDTENDVLPHKDLFSEIIRGVARRSRDIDEIVSASLSSRWTFDRLEMILRAILRAGVYELKESVDTPARVIITEYVDVAHAFYEGREPAMVNGMLDRIAHLIRPDEFGDGSRDG